MIPSIQKNEGKRSSFIVHYNSLIRNNSFPKFAARSIKLRSVSLSKNRTKKKTSYSIKQASIINALFSIISIILIFCESELYFSNNFTLNESIEILRWVIFLCCFLHGLLIFFIHLTPESQKKVLLLNRIYKLFTDKDRFKYFFIDFFIVMIHTPPGISVTFRFSQLGFNSILSYSDIVFILSLLRIKFLITVILHHSKDNKVKSQFILSLFEKDNSLKFILKSIIHRYSYSSFIICFGCSIAFFGLLLRNLEKHLNLNSIYDFLWIAFATESTVGYGDSNPKTHIGRIIAGIAAILGIFIYSYSVMTIRAMTSLSNEELLIAKHLKYKNKLNKVLKPLAALLIQLQWKQYKNKTSSLSIRFKEKIKRFKFLRKKFKIDFELSLNQQIAETEKSLPKILRPLNERFRNVNKAVMLSRSFNLASHICLNSLRKLNRLSSVFVNTSGKTTLVNKYISPHQKNIMIEGSKAMKSLMIKKICNSPVSSSSIGSHSPANK